MADDSVDRQNLWHIPVDLLQGIDMRFLLRMAEDLQIEQQKSHLTFIMKHLYDMFIERDCNFLEVNPLVLTYDERLCANHAKIRIDHDAYYRQQELVMDRDISQMHYKERISRENGLRYINIEGGSTGIICNGAGYAMASMDLITLYGAKPANFLDLGG